MLVVFFRAVFLYIVVIFSLRLMGKRQLGELQPSELVITILISNIASLPVEDTSIPMILGTIPVFVLVGFEIILSNLSLRSKRFRSFLSGKPVIVIHDGQIDQKELRRIRFSIDDLMESLRQSGIFDLRDVQYAIVETTGTVSVMQKFSAQPVTSEMLGISGEEPSPPSVIISDGQLVKSALSVYSLSEDWLREILRKEHLRIRDIFLMTADVQKNYHIIERER